MSEMVERVAKAIKEAQQMHWNDMARAAIEAMRELPESPGPRYTAGEYSRRNMDAAVSDALHYTAGERLQRGVWGPL